MRGCRRHQPPNPSCPRCSARYARRAARTILATNPRRLFAVEFDTTLSHEQFRSWRTAARNLVDHKRRECRWWREVAMQVWLGADGRLRGVVSLDAITCEEFEEAFRRWPITLANIEADELAEAIYAAVEPTVTVHSGGQSGQAVRFTLKPQKVASPLKGAGYRASQASHPEHAIEPMPCLFA